MSTLTTSPSPAASPHTPFHIQRHHSYSRSPRASPRPFSAPSPRRAFNAPQASASPSVQRLQRQYSRESLVERGPAVGAGRAFKGYVDAGTQYSPEGYPPTAGHNVAATTTITGQPPGSAGSAKKRKEIERGEDSERQQMSEANSAASSSSAARPGQQPPGEPQPRVDPSASASGFHNVATTATSSAEQQPEPEEARTTQGHSSAPKRSRSDAGTVKLMPREYWTCNPKDLGILISHMLMELIRLNDRIPLRDGRLTRFHSRAPPGISVSDYLQRLIQHATLSPPILLSMVYYIDRLCALYPAFTINSLTVHRFLITAATVAAKGLSDSFWTNPTYARIGGIPVSELATLELEFLQKVHWKIVPKPEVLEEYYRSLVERTEGFALERSNSESSSLDESGDEGREGEAEGDQDDRMVEAPT